MKFFHSIFLLLVVSGVLGEDSIEEICFPHNFETPGIFYPSTGVCGVMQNWEEGNYATTNISPFHPYGTRFIRPRATFSCVTTQEKIIMGANGKLEINVYMNPTSNLDQIRVVVYERHNVGDVIVGEFTSSLAYENYEQGWNTFEIYLGGSPSYEGFIAMSGRATAQSHILVDSIRYIPQELNEDDEQCTIYSTFLSDCIEYEFGNDFDVLFGNQHNICSDSQPWAKPTNADGNVIGVSPGNDNIPSCASTRIPLYGGGNLTVQLSVDSDSYFDSVLVGITDDQDNLNTAVYNKFTGNVNSELEINLEHIRENYVAEFFIVGFKTTDEATVLVKSLKFQPTSPTSEECRPLIEARKRIPV